KLRGDAPAGAVVCCRLLLSVVIMRRSALFSSQTAIQPTSSPNWVSAVLSSAVLACQFICWSASLGLSSSASSVTLVAMQPIFAFIGTYFFFGERFSVAAFISLFITIVGSIIISWGDFQVSGLAFFGDLLALLGAAFVTDDFLLGQQLRRNHS